MTDWDSLLRSQCGMFTRDQAHAHHIDDHHIAWRVHNGRWRRVHPRVFASFSGPLPREARLWAAVLYAGPGAVLCLDTAAYAWGLRDQDPNQVHVMVNRSSRPRAVPGVMVHRSLLLRRDDVYLSQRPPRTTVERTVVDLVGRTRRPDDLAALLAAAVQKGLTSPDRLERAIVARATLANRALARDVLALASSGAHSLLEIHFARTCERHGLPTSDRQAPRQGPDGAVVLDAFFADYKVAVELDGRLGHMAVDRWWADMSRDNWLQVEGSAVLRFPGFVVLSDGCAVARSTAKALASRGWPGPMRPCPSCPTSAGAATLS